MKNGAKRNLLSNRITSFSNPQFIEAKLDKQGHWQEEIIP